jgi:hypothetical protein
MYNNLYFFEMMKKFNPYDFTKCSSNFQNPFEALKQVTDCYNNFYSMMLEKMSHSNCMASAFSQHENCNCPFTSHAKKAYKDMVEYSKVVAEDMTANSKDLFAKKMTVMQEAFSTLSKIFHEKIIDTSNSEDCKKALSSILDSFKDLSENISNKNTNYMEQAHKRFKDSIDDFYNLINNVKKTQDK